MTLGKVKCQFSSYVSGIVEILRNEIIYVMDISCHNAFNTLSTADFHVTVIEGRRLVYGLNVRLMA